MARERSGRGADPDVLTEADMGALPGCLREQVPQCSKLDWERGWIAGSRLFL
jgi:hypothetical protein